MATRLATTHKRPPHLRGPVKSRPGLVHTQPEGEASQGIARVSNGQDGDKKPEVMLYEAAAGVDKMFERENQLREQLKSLVANSDAVIGGYEGWVAEMKNEKRQFGGDRTELENSMAATNVRTTHWKFLQEHDIVKGFDEFESFKNSHERQCLEEFTKAPLVEENDEVGRELRPQNADQPDQSTQFKNPEMAEMWSRVQALEGDIQQRIASGTITTWEVVNMKMGALSELLNRGARGATNERCGQPCDFRG